MTVNIENCKLEDIFISYISLSAPTEGVRSFQQNLKQRNVQWKNNIKLIILFQETFKFLYLKGGGTSSIVLFNQG